MNPHTTLNPSLWRYNQVTGYWTHERSCLPETAEQWLAVFQKDEPDAYFKISKHKPKGRPEDYEPRRTR